MKRFDLLFQTTTLVICFLLSACVSTVQTTDGREYLKKYEGLPSVSCAGNDKVDMATALREAANIRPQIRFPARIGLARLEHGQLSGIPTEEQEIWLETQKQLESEFGSIQPLSPLVAEMTSQQLSFTQKNPVEDVMNKLRLGAARQHLDLVIIYEVYNTSKDEKNVLAIGDLTIIGGYLLPARHIESTGFANAMVIDVMQGYPYLHVTGQGIKDTSLSTTWGMEEVRKDLGEKQRIAAVKDLARQLVEALQKLKFSSQAKQG